MKKNYILLVLVCFSVISKAQFSNYCGSPRYDTEVFQNVLTTSNVTFGSNTDASGALTTLTMDIYEPDSDTVAIRPLIVWVHGGSFVSGTKNDGDVTSLCQHFAKRGYVCASINYRLGFASFPPSAAQASAEVFMSVQDMKASIRFFRKDAATTNTYRIDPSLIFGGGSSAGAFSALHLAYLDQPSELPVGVDTTVIGGFEGNSGNPGYASNVNAVIDLCGALGDKTWIHPGDVPFVAMHGNMDNTVPYATAVINLLGVVPLMLVDGSYSIAHYADSIGLHNAMYTFFGADHVPYSSSTAYMDTTVRFVSNFLYSYMGCTPTDPTPLPNTFSTGINSVASNNPISVYPNPAHENVFIKFNNESQNHHLILSDICGRKVFEKNSSGNQDEINLSGLNEGIYLLEITNNNSRFVSKISVN